MIRNFFVAVATLAAMTVAAAPVSAQFGEGNSANNLFSQYYTQPGASTVEAGLYVAPHYVPSHVGHTYYTYQPLMPHEMMYQHTRNYYNYYNTGGYYGGYNALNKTQVRWQAGANHMGSLPFSGPHAQALQWKMQKKRYCLEGGCDDGGRKHSLRRKCSSCDTGDCGGETCSGGCTSGSCAAIPRTRPTIR